MTTLYRQKLIAIAMLAAAAFTVMRADGDFVYPLFVCLTGLLSLSKRASFTLRPAQRTILVLVITLLFALKYRFFAPYQPIAFTNLSWQVPWRNVAQYFLALMVVQFFIPHRGRLTTAVPLLGLVCFFCVAHMTSSPQFDYTYHFLIMVFLVLSMIFTASYRRELSGRNRTFFPSRQGLAALITVVALGSGWWFAKLGYEHLQQIDLNLSRFYMTLNRISSPAQRVTAMGFSHATELNSIKKLNLNKADRVAIRVFSDREPGYLRARAFDSFSDSRWESRSDVMDIFPERNPPGYLPPKPRNNIFVLTPGPPETGTVLDIWPDPDIEIAIYAPLQTAAISIPVEQIVIDDLHIPDADQLRGGVNYQVLKTGERDFEFPSQMTREKTLALPENLDPRIEEIAREIFSQVRTDEEKIQAVERYFHTNYQYNLGIQVPRDQDPLTYFLTEQPAAHCEYFASGAAVLLRFADVPTRYVTGFVCSEKNTYADYWMARNRDAHAWAEAWNAQSEQWEIVEATPASGLPLGHQANSMSYFWDYLKYLRQELRVAIYAGGLQGFFLFAGEKIRQIVLWFLISPVGVPITIGLILLTIRSWLISSHRKRIHYSDPFVKRLDQLRNKVDRRLVKNGYRRRPAETLNQFVRRIEDSASVSSNVKPYMQWYSMYIEQRFGRNRDEGIITSLSREMPRSRLSKNGKTQPVSAH